MERESGLRIKPGVTRRLKEPRWVVPFLRALERTGSARVAAEDAGIDHSTAYARRRAHRAFAAAWAEALRRGRAERERIDEEEIAAIRDGRTPPLPPPAALRVPPSPAEGGGAELTVSAGKVRRVGHGRWSKEKETIFFDELAATSNMRMAADAAGVSTNAILARRLKNRLFAAKFEAVVQSAKAAIDLYLVEETKKSFDPDDLDTGDVRPKVTIDQAIKISQLNRSKRQDQSFAEPFADDEDSASGEDPDEIRARIIGKLRRMQELDRREQLAQGWTHDESYDLMIPPGYVRGPEYRPKPAEPPAG